MFTPITQEVVLEALARRKRAGELWNLYFTIEEIAELLSASVPATRLDISRECQEGRCRACSPEACFFTRRAEDRKTDAEAKRKRRAEHETRLAREAADQILAAEDRQLNGELIPGAVERRTGDASDLVPVPLSWPTRITAEEAEAMEGWAWRVLAAHERRAIVTAEIRRGKTMAAIGEDWGVRPQEIGRIYRAAIRDLDRADAESMRHMQIERLELMWEHLLPQISTGDVVAIRTGVLLLKRMAVMFGTDAPVQINVKAIAASYAERFGLDAEEAQMLEDSIAKDLKRGGEVQEAEWRAVEGQ